MSVTMMVVGWLMTTRPSPPRELVLKAAPMTVELA
jgi:hypothetical protein